MNSTPVSASLGSCIILSTIYQQVGYAPYPPAALLNAMDRPLIRIVSLTIAENGFCLNAATKQLDLDNPTIAADLAGPARPHSAVGIVNEAL